METAPRPVSVTPEQVTEFLRKGAEPETVKRLLVATGAWSESGAEEIVSTLATQPADAMQGAIGDLGWPGPPDDPPPLFAT
jgi:ribosomal protein S16